MRAQTRETAPPAATSASPGLRMYFEILAHGVPDLVVARYLPQRTPLVIRDDVSYGLIQVLENALLGSDDREPWADVSSVLDADAWAYSLLRSRVAFVLRDALRERQHLTQTSITELETVLESSEPSPAESVHPLTVLEEIPLSEELRGSTGLRRLHLQAQQVRAALNVPVILAPFTRFQRDQLLALVVAVPQVAMDSLDRVCCGSDGADHPVDALWDNYSPAAALRLSYADPRSVHLLVTSALSPRSRPGRDLLLAHRGLIKQLSGRRGWPSFAASAQRAWLAEFYSHTADKGIRQELRSCADDWSSICIEASRFVGQPLGATPEAVDRTLCRLLEQAAQR